MVIVQINLAMQQSSQFSNTKVTNNDEHVFHPQRIRLAGSSLAHIAYVLRIDIKSK